MGPVALARFTRAVDHCDAWLLAGARACLELASLAQHCGPVKDRCWMRASAACVAGRPARARCLAARLVSSLEPRDAGRVTRCACDRQLSDYYSMCNTFILYTGALLLLCKIISFNEEILRGLPLSLTVT